jgi:hypothetical protein
MYKCIHKLNNLRTIIILLLLLLLSLSIFYNFNNTAFSIFINSISIIDIFGDFKCQNLFYF